MIGGFFLCFLIHFFVVFTLITIHNKSNNHKVKRTSQLFLLFILPIIFSKRFRHFLK